MKTEHEKLRNACKTKIQDCCRGLGAVLVDKEKDTSGSSNIFSDSKVKAIKSVADALNVLNRLSVSPRANDKGELNKTVLQLSAKSCENIIPEGVQGALMELGLYLEFIRTSVPALYSDFRSDFSEDDGLARSILDMDDIVSGFSNEDAGMRSRFDALVIRDKNIQQRFFKDNLL
nr:hypothetical protein [Endozoicomonas sp.]